MPIPYLSWARCPSHTDVQTKTSMEIYLGLKAIEKLRPLDGVLRTNRRCAARAAPMSSSEEDHMEARRPIMVFDPRSEFCRYLAAGAELLRVKGCRVLSRSAPGSKQQQLTVNPAQADVSPLAMRNYVTKKSDLKSR